MRWPWNVTWEERVRIVMFRPQADITTYELALCVNWVQALDKETITTAQDLWNLMREEARHLLVMERTYEVTWRPWGNRRRIVSTLPVYQMIRDLDVGREPGYSTLFWPLWAPYTRASYLNEEDPRRGG